MRYIICIYHRYNKSQGSVLLLSQQPNNLRRSDKKMPLCACAMALAGRWTSSKCVCLRLYRAHILLNMTSTSRGRNQISQFSCMQSTSKMLENLFSESMCVPSKNKIAEVATVALFFFAFRKLFGAPLSAAPYQMQRLGC